MEEAISEKGFIVVDGSDEGDAILAAMRDRRKKNAHDSGCDCFRSRSGCVQLWRASSRLALSNPEVVDHSAFA